MGSALTSSKRARAACAASASFTGDIWETRCVMLPTSRPPCRAMSEGGAGLLVGQAIDVAQQGIELVIRRCGRARFRRLGQNSERFPRQIIGQRGGRSLLK